MKRLICFTLFFGGVLSVLISCEETSETATNVQKVDDVTRYGSMLSILPTLSEAAKSQAISWSVFEDFEANTQRLKNQTLPTLQDISEQLTLQTDSLLTKIPDTINTRYIYARLMLVNTRAKVLEQLAKENNVDSLQLEMGLEEMNIAAQNLFIEMNRTFKKSKIDDELKETEQKEIEKQRKFLDSVYKVELQDNKGN
ncbi:hypothetical protein [Rasiella sp. SM2506]|uniref:hypothetical protein n=1 Tax=Rasiella sp. SM2506 TaxID=3423914 RepID=UPI003D79144B